MTKKQMAGAIRTTPETLSRLLRRLGNHGALQWKGRMLRFGPAPLRAAGKRL